MRQHKRSGMESRSKLNIVRYLKRIGVDEGELNIDAQSLCLLQKAHLLNVPFENLDIHWKQPIVVDTGSSYKKIVEGKRGGFCYELNGLFNELLRCIGFRTRIVSARVYNGVDFGPEFDHAAIIATIGELEYLVDVGFGDFSAEPLRIVPDIEQHDREGVFVIRRGDFGTLEVLKNSDEGWRPQYSFTMLARDLSEFAEMCDFQQYSPDSHFKKGRMCSILTETGRKTVTDSKFLITENGARTESAVNSSEEFDRLLNDEFGIRQIQ